MAEKTCQSVGAAHVVAVKQRMSFELTPATLSQKARDLMQRRSKSLPIYPEVGPEALLRRAVVDTVFPSLRYQPSHYFRNIDASL